MKVFFFSSIIILVLNYSTAYSQSASKKDVNNIKSSTIQLLKNDDDQADEKQLNKLRNKSEKLAEYNDGVVMVKRMNADFERAVKASWTFSKLEATSIYTNKIKEEKATAYAIYFKVVRVQIIDERIGRVERTVDPPYISVFIGMFKNGKEKEIYADIGIPITSKFSDFFHAVSTLQNYFAAKESGTWKNLSCFGCVPDMYKTLADKNANQLSSVTLLIDKKYLTEEVSESNVATIYPHPYKVATTDEIESFIINKEKGYAFLAPCMISGELTSMPLSHVFHIINIAEGKLIGFDKGTLTKPKTKEVPLTEPALKAIVKRDD